MRHRVAGTKLGRTTSHRKALLRTMVTEFFENEKMITTVPKAKAVRSIAEKMITLGKREHLHARRQALSFLRKKSVVFKLFDSLAPRFADRHGGYTRITRLGARVGDAAELALLEFVDGKPEKAEAKSTKSAKKAPTKAAGKSKKADASSGSSKGSSAKGSSVKKEAKKPRKPSKKGAEPDAKAEE